MYFCKKGNFTLLYLREPTTTRIGKVSIALEMLMNNSRFDTPHISRNTRQSFSEIVDRIQILRYCTRTSRADTVLLMTLLYKTFMEFERCAKSKAPTSGLALHFSKEQSRESLPNALRINICSPLSRLVIYATGMLSYLYEIHEPFAPKLALPRANVRPYLKHRGYKRAAPSPFSLKFSPSP